MTNVDPENRPDGRGATLSGIRTLIEQAPRDAVVKQRAALAGLWAVLENLVRANAEFRSAALADQPRDALELLAAQAVAEVREQAVEVEWSTELATDIYRSAYEATDEELRLRINAALDVLGPDWSPPWPEDDDDED